MAAETLRVTVSYAPGDPLTDRVWQRELVLPAGATVAQALAASGWQADFPGQDPWRVGVGLYGKRCESSTALSDHDRVEIYRALDFDPMESRRRRAAHKEKAPGSGRARR